MGLDMSLHGEILIYNFHDGPKDTIEIIGYENYKLHSLVFELGYWRRHHNLHNYISRSFKNIEDDIGFVEITLGLEDLDTILHVIENDEIYLDHPSCYSKESTIQKFKKAKEFLIDQKLKTGMGENFTTFVTYTASW